MYMMTGFRPAKEVARLGTQHVATTHARPKSAPSRLSHGQQSIIKFPISFPNSNTAVEAYHPSNHLPDKDSAIKFIEKFWGDKLSEAQAEQISDNSVWTELEGINFLVKYADPAFRAESCREVLEANTNNFRFIKANQQLFEDIKKTIKTDISLLPGILSKFHTKYSDKISPLIGSINSYTNTPKIVNSYNNFIPFKGILEAAFGILKSELKNQTSLCESVQKFSNTFLRNIEFVETKQAVGDHGLMNPIRQAVGLPVIAKDHSLTILMDQPSNRTRTGSQAADFHNNLDEKLPDLALSVEKISIGHETLFALKKSLASGAFMCSLIEADYSQEEIELLVTNRFKLGVYEASQLDVYCSDDL